MTPQQLITTLIVAVMALLGGAAAAAGINAYARRKVTKAEADNKTVATAEILMARQQIQLDRGDKAREKLHKELNKVRLELKEVTAQVDKLRLENMDLQHALRRYRTEEENTQ